MNQEQSVIGYDEFMPQPFQQHRRIFDEISAENRALLIKTHIERWLAANPGDLIMNKLLLLKKQ